MWKFSHMEKNPITCVHAGATYTHHTLYTSFYFHFEETNLMWFHVPCFPLNGTPNKPVIYMNACHFDSYVKNSLVTSSIIRFFFSHVFVTCMFLSCVKMLRSREEKLIFRVVLTCHARKFWSTGKKKNQFTSHPKLTLWKCHHLKFLPTC